MAGNKFLVVIDPLTDDQLALERAVKLAHEINASLHLFCCTYLEPEYRGEFTSRKEAKTEQLAETKAWLQELAEPLLRQDLQVSCEVVWNQKWEEMVVQSASRIGASLIVKSSFQHSALSRKFSRTSDFHLMRTAPCPILLVKLDAPWQNSIILAAVCLDNREPEHEILNNRIFSQAKRLSIATGFELHLVSAMNKAPELATLFHWTGDDSLTDQDLAAQRFGIPASHMHLVEGAAKDVIGDLAQSLHADVLVMGTLARKGVAATLIGNTAEKVIDQLEIDILVVS